MTKSPLKYRTYKAIFKTKPIGIAGIQVVHSLAEIGMWCLTYLDHLPAEDASHASVAHERFAVLVLVAVQEQARRRAFDVVV